MNYLEKIGTKDAPLLLKTPPGSSSYTMHTEEKDGNTILVCKVGKTKLFYHIDAITDSVNMLKEHGDWMLLGSKDEKQETKENTLEHWARSPKNPIGGWYGLKKNFRGRFAMYIPPLLEYLGLVELEHNKRNNKIKSI